MRAKIVGNKSSGNGAKKRFLYLHEYRDQKMGGKKRAKQFFHKHTNSASKNVGKKIVGKSAKKVFLYSHEYRELKMGGKTREIIFKETHE